MKVLLLLLATAAAVNAMENFFWLGDYENEMGEVGKGCCLPTQWEGRVGAWHISKRFLRPRVRASDSKIGLDFSGKKVAARSMLYCPKTKKVYEARTVADYNAKKAYFIFKDKCKAFSLNKTLIRPCIPDVFRQFSPYAYGAGSSSLALTPYGYRNGSVSVFSVVTRDSCVPVKGAYRIKRRFHSSMGSYQYYNITLGNTDKDLYSVPATCNQVASVSSGNLWYKFKKYVSKTVEEQPFTPESKFGDLVQSDALTQLMDIIDSNSMMLMGANDHSHRSGRDRWYQRRHWRSRDSEDRDY